MDLLNTKNDPKETTSENTQWKSELAWVVRCRTLTCMYCKTLFCEIYSFCMMYNRDPVTHFELADNQRDGNPVATKT